MVTNLYSRQTYYPYGQVRTQEGNTSPTDYGFTGQKLDDSTDLMYYGARYYDPVLARLVQPDSIVPSAGNPQTLNRYSYALNNPVKYIDPSGHDGWDIINTIGEFATGAASEYWYNTAWFMTESRESLAVQPNESEAETAGRVVGDVMSMVQAVDEVASGVGLITGGGLGGAATCLETVGLGCVAGVAVMGAGATLAGRGIGEGVNGALGAGNNLGNLLSMASRRGPIPAITSPTDRGGLRRAMLRAGITPPRGMTNPQAHHNLPWVFKDWFAGLGRGLNVNDIQFGRWVEGTLPGSHQDWTAAYEQEWRIWIRNNQNATRQEVLDFLNSLLSSGRFPSQ